MKYTIITVCYNDMQGLKRTMESVLHQTDVSYEYVVVDGGSNDGTLRVITDMQARFALMNVQLRYVSEKDNGIFNAMNKGIDMASGEWVIYLNSGDYLCSPDVLSTASKKLNDKADVAYGDCVLRRGNLYKYIIAPVELIIDEGIPFCHQSMFIKNSVLKNYKFVEEWKVCGDYDQFIRLYQDGYKFIYLHMPVSVFEIGGVSSTDEGRIIVSDESIDVLSRYKIITKEEAWRKRNAIQKAQKFGKVKLLLKRSVVVYKMVLRVKGWKSVDEWDWVKN